MPVKTKMPRTLSECAASKCLLISYISLPLPDHQDGEDAAQDHHEKERESPRQCDESRKEEDKGQIQRIEKDQLRTGLPADPDIGDPKDQKPCDPDACPPGQQLMVFQAAS